MLSVVVTIYIDRQMEQYRIKKQCERIDGVIHMHNKNTYSNYDIFLICIIKNTYREGERETISHTHTQHNYDLFSYVLERGRERYYITHTHEQLAERDILHHNNYDLFSYALEGERERERETISHT